METDNQEKVKPKIILFDVYETLLDMSDVRARLNRIMDSRRGYTLWLELFMQYCFVDNCTVQFNDFDSIAAATMQMTGKEFGRVIGSQEIDQVLDLLRQLPVQEGTQDGFSQLVQLDFRIAALTNSSERIVRDRMERTGLISYFEKVLSAERVKKYKPCIEVYEWAAQQVNVPIKEVLLVTAHGWDIAGGANAGMLTAYMNRNNQMLYPLAPSPNLICKNLVDLANQLTPINQPLDKD